jgi:hypothetical protein
MSGSEEGRSSASMGEGQPRSEAREGEREREIRKR